MTDRDRLEKLYEKATEEYEKTNKAQFRKSFICDYLLANGVIVLPCKVGDKAAVRACCECVYTLPVYEECRNECPFENDCPCEECDNANERIFVTRIDRIFNDGYGWKFEFRYLAVEANINDFGVSVFVGENAEQQALEYEKALKEREG